MSNSVVYKKQENRNKVLLIIALLLSLSIVVSLFVSPLMSIFGATYNVSQSRKVADINSFPESYRDGLEYIKQVYPNAKFVLYDTGLDWNNDLLTKENQLRTGVNLITSSADDFWKSKDPEVYDADSNTYAEIEPGWNQVSSEGIQYYLDPRNFFNEKDIFMFLNLEFDGTQTVEGTMSVIGNSFMSTQTLTDEEGNEVSFADALYKIGKESGVSPYLLACRIRQEQGAGKSAMISGTYGNYSGYYNYFNVGANGSTTSTILSRGLNYAKANNWSTPYKSILGGAKVLADNYVNSEKNTLYLQHFNVVANNKGTVSYSVYMANIMAPYAENRMMISSFSDKNAPYTFVIPVYKNMPKSSVKSPDYDTTEDCNLRSIKILENCNLFGPFDKDTYSYDVKLDSFAKKIKISVELDSEQHKIFIDNTEIKRDTNQMQIEYEMDIKPGFNTIPIKCQSTSGMYKTYYLNVINDDGNTHFRSTAYNLSLEYFTSSAECKVSDVKESIDVLNGTVLVIDKDNKNKNNDDYCSTSDTVIIRSNNDEIVYKKPIMIYGDVNCDGHLNDTDVKMIKEHILELNTLSKAQLKYADITRDGSVTIEDIGMLENVIKTTSNNSNTVALMVNTNKDEAAGNFNISISPPSSPCVIEGFLTYNEGNVSSINATNGGRIHFIADGDTVLFENGFDNLTLSPVIPSKSVKFKFDIISSYNYALKEDCDVKAESFDVIMAEKSNTVDKLDEKGDSKLHIHEYKYTDNNDATLTSSSTQTGVCKKCGKLNTKILHGTRLELIDRIDIVISSAHLGKNGLPDINVLSPSVKKATTVWRDQNGAMTLNDKENITVRAGDTYELGKIMFAPSDQYIFDEDTSLYINGKLFNGNSSLFGTRISFASVGKFVF